MRLAARARSCRGPGGLDRLRLRSLSPPRKGRPPAGGAEIAGVSLAPPLSYWASHESGGGRAVPAGHSG